MSADATIAPLTPDATSHPRPPSDQQSHQRALDAEAFRLHVQEGMDFATIARRMRCTKTTASNRVSRCERRLASRLTATIARLKARNQARLEKLYALALEDYTADRTIPRLEACLSVVRDLDALFPTTPAPAQPTQVNVIQQATIAPDERAAFRAALGRPPLPQLPPAPPVTLDTPPPGND